MVSRSIAKDLSWTTWESSARPLKSRIWTCAARAEPCRRSWSIGEASTPGFHAECSRTSAFVRSEHKHSKARTDVALSGTSDMLWCAPEEWRRNSARWPTPTSLAPGSATFGAASQSNTDHIRSPTMQSRYIAGLCAAVFSAGMSGTGADQPLNVRLGYPADSKLLIINADDLAMSHSENDASLTAFDNKLITSATVMVPCPWFGEVAVYARAHPDADLGLHLTLTAEWQTFRWGPVTSRTLVPSLVGPDGFFYSTTEEFARHAKVDEVETEVRAQIERARSMGLEPTHLDARMHSLYATPPLFAVLRKVARDYRLPIRMARNEQVFRDLLPYVAAGDPFPDAIFSPLGDVQPSAWKDYYIDVVKHLQPGVSELFVHLAHNDAEMRAVTVNFPVWDAAWRQRDLDVMSSPEFRQALVDNHVILIGWRPIQRLVR